MAGGPERSRFLRAHGRPLPAVAATRGSMCPHGAVGQEWSPPCKTLRAGPERTLGVVGGRVWQELLSAPCGKRPRYIGSSPVGSDGGSAVVSRAGLCCSARPRIARSCTVLLSLASRSSAAGSLLDVEPSTPRPLGPSTPPWPATAGNTIRSLGTPLPAHAPWAESVRAWRLPHASRFTLHANNLNRPGAAKALRARRLLQLWMRNSPSVRAADPTAPALESPAPA